MTEDTARLILVAIAAAAVGFWLVTTSWLVRLARTSAPGDAGGGSGVAWDEPEVPASSPGAGRLELKGRPDELAERFASDLARHGLAGAPVAVKAADRTRVRFEVLGMLGASPTAAGRQQAGACATPRAIEVEFRPGKAGGTAAEYRFDPALGRGLLVAAGIVSALGLVAIVAIFWGLWTYAAPDPRPGVRGQVIQMIQCIHFLWPPWLFGMLHRRMNLAYTQALSARLQNLPYL